MKKTDLRVKRTHKMIIEAFVNLVEEKGYDAVTVQDIAEAAMINRATFYAHFKDKQDLYEQMFDRSIQTFTSVLDTEQFSSGNKVRLKTIEYILTKMYEKSYEKRVFFRLLLDNSATEMIRKKLADILYDKYADIFAQLKITENNMDVPIDFIIEYMTSIFIGTLHWWLTSDTEMPANQLAKLVIKLVGNSHLTVLGIEIEKD